LVIFSGAKIEKVGFSGNSLYRHSPGNGASASSGSGVIISAGELALAGALKAPGTVSRADRT
jgi:hypothetical protein